MAFQSPDFQRAVLTYEELYTILNYKLTMLLSKKLYKQLYTILVYKLTILLYRKLLCDIIIPAQLHTSLITLLKALTVISFNFVIGALPAKVSFHKAAPQ